MSSGVKRSSGPNNCIFQSHTLCKRQLFIFLMDELIARRLECLDVGNKYLDGTIIKSKMS